jgi:hypothetical protein
MPSLTTTLGGTIAAVCSRCRSRRNLRIRHGQVATATFQLLYILIVLSLDRRWVVHFEVTPNPTQDWLSGQMTEAFPWDTAPRYLLRDRDKSYGPAFRHRVRAMGITEVIIAPRSPWQDLWLLKIIFEVGIGWPVMIAADDFLSTE